MSLESEDCLVYSTHTALQSVDHSVHADGNIFMYSFNESKPQLIMTRKHTKNPRFTPMVVNTLFAAEGILFDGGQYGLFDTLSDTPIIKDIYPNNLAFYEGHVYFSDSSKSYRFPLNDYSKMERLVTSETRAWLEQQGVKTKSNFSVPIVCANGQEYGVYNNISFETGKRTACIKGPEGDVILETNWIHDMVVFPEKVLESRLKLDQKP